MENAIIANPQQIQSVSDCVKGTYHFSYTLYQNICDGTTAMISNGFWDYAGFLMLSLIFVVLLLILITVIFDIY